MKAWAVNFLIGVAAGAAIVVGEVLFKSGKILSRCQCADCLAWGSRTRWQRFRDWFGYRLVSVGHRITFSK
jgi:hypothetical protein